MFVLRTDQSNLSKLRLIISSPATDHPFVCQQVPNGKREAPDNFMSVHRGQPVNHRSVETE